MLRYLEGIDDPFVNEVKEMLSETLGSNCQSSANNVVTLRTLCQEVGCPYHENLCVPVCSTAIVVLWLALHKEKFPLLASSLQAAAGVAGKQRWALILPSSARVSLVTYTTVIAVRYPELDNVQNDMVCFGNYHRAPMAASFQSFGMHLLPTCTRPQTLVQLLNGSVATTNSPQMKMAAWQYYTIATKWWRPLVTRSGLHNQRVRCVQRASFPVQV